METIPLEDQCEDIVGKAMRGLGISEERLAGAAGLPVARVAELRAGAVDEGVIRAVAGPLGLDAEALVVAARRGWAPEPVEVEGLAMFNTPWRDMRVNAYIVFDPASREAAVFDTGADAGGMLAFIGRAALRVGAVFLTHTHGDHIADLARVRAALGNPPVFVNPREALDVGEGFLDDGGTASIGALRLTARHTWGHSAGGNTYFIEGLSRPLAVVGDSLFAGSMGGGVVSYAAALENNREIILRFPEATVLCPGHGPLTTVGEERAHNPFFTGGAQAAGTIS